MRTTNIASRPSNVIAFNRAGSTCVQAAIPRPTEAPAPSTLRQKCERIERLTRGTVPPDMWRRFQQLDDDQLSLMLILASAFAKHYQSNISPELFQHLLGVGLSAIERGVRS